MNPIDAKILNYDNGNAHSMSPIGEVNFSYGLPGIEDTSYLAGGFLIPLDKKEIMEAHEYRLSVSDELI